MHAAHVDPLYPEHVRVLCEPFEVFRFDFAKPPERDGAQHLQVFTLLHFPLYKMYFLTTPVAQMCVLILILGKEKTASVTQRALGRDYSSCS